jgi:hypothetical protein
MSARPCPKECNIPVKVQVSITTTGNRSLYENRVLVELRALAQGQVHVLAEDVGLDAIELGARVQVLALVLHDPFFDGVHVKRDQRCVGVGVSGFQAWAQECESLRGAQVAAVGNVGSLEKGINIVFFGARRRIGSAA